MGVLPALGRWFSESDHEPGTAETIIVTHGYWQIRLGADANVIGRTITVDRRPREVIGVLPQGFTFMQRFTFVSAAPAVPGIPAKGPDGAASDEAIETLARPTWFGTSATSTAAARRGTRSSTTRSSICNGRRIRAAAR